MPAPSDARRRRMLLGRERPQGALRDSECSAEGTDEVVVEDDIPLRAAAPSVGRKVKLAGVPMPDPRHAWLPYLTWPPGGAAGETKLRITDERTGERPSILLRTPQLTLGSDETLHLTRPEWAPRHAAVQAVPGGVLVLSAVAGGLERAGEKTDAVLLRLGGTVGVGPYQIEVRRLPPPPEGFPRPRLHRFLASRTVARDTDAATDGVTVGWRGGSVRLCESTPVLTVGSHRRAHLRLGDAAPLAALLLFTPTGPAAVDLRSPRGLILNDAPTRRTPLTPGDRLTIDGVALGAGYIRRCPIGPPA